MFAQIAVFERLRKGLVDRLPMISDLVVVHYPSISDQLWEFTLAANQETTVSWRNGEYLVACDKAEEWWVIYDQPGKVDMVHQVTFNGALITAYALIEAVSNDYNVESVIERPTETEN